MPHRVLFDRESGIVDIWLIGPVTGADLRHVTTEAAAVQKRSGALKFLVDLNGYDVMASTVDIYDLAERQYWAEDLDRRSRIAVILPTSRSGANAARFHETVCVNRGWNARVCPSRASATDWLNAAPDSPAPAIHDDAVAR